MKEPPWMSPTTGKGARSREWRATATPEQRTRRGKEGRRCGKERYAKKSRGRARAEETGSCRGCGRAGMGARPRTPVLEANKDAEKAQGLAGAGKVVGG